MTYQNMNFSPYWITRLPPLNCSGFRKFCAETLAYDVLSALLLNVW